MNIKIASTTYKTYCSTYHNIETTDKFNLYRVCELPCASCNEISIGQTGRKYKQRYKEHLGDFKH